MENRADGARALHRRRDRAFARGARLSPPLSRAPARLIAGLGIAADARLFVLKAPAPVDAALYALALWLVAPWLVVLALASLDYLRVPRSGVRPRGGPSGSRARVPGLLAGTALAAPFEASAFGATFLAPQGPRAALAYATKPLWQLGLIRGAIAVAAGVRRWRGQPRGH